MSEIIYSVFQTVADKDFRELINKIPEPRIISFSQKNYSFIRRAISSNLFKEIPEHFKEMLFLQELSPAKCNTLSGNFCAISLDDTEEVNNILELFKLLPNCKKYIVLIPRITIFCQELIDRSKLDITTLQLPLEIIPLEENFYLIPSPCCFNRCFVQKNLTDIFTIARSLLKLQLITGGVERIFYAGEMAQKTFTLLQEMKGQLGNIDSNYPTFDDIFIIDRTTDLITPLVSQFSYGGLLDDLFENDYGYYKLPDDIQLSKNQKIPKTNEILISGLNDACYNILKGMLLIDAQRYCSEHYYNNVKLLDELDTSIGKRGLVPIFLHLEKVQEFQPFFITHVALIDKIKRKWDIMSDIYNYECELFFQNPLDLSLIKQLINGGRIVEAIRLLCFSSLVSSESISSKNIEDIQRRIIGYCGFQATTDLIDLEKSGLLSNDNNFFSIFNFKQQPKFYELDKILHLLSFQPENEQADDINLDNNQIIEETPIKEQKEQEKPKKENSNKKQDENNHFIEEPPPQDISQGYDGYAPILLRLVQNALYNKWEKGSSIDLLLDKMKIPHGISGEASKYKNPRRVLVFVIGGVTQTETFLFTDMGKKIFKNDINFYVGSTDIITGSRLIKSVCPFIASKSVYVRI